MIIIIIILINCNWVVTRWQWMCDVLTNLDGTRLNGLFVMYLNVQLSTRFFPLMVYHNYTEISKWDDNMM